MLNAGLNSLLNFPSMVSASHCHRSLLVPIAAAIFVSVHGVFLLLIFGFSGAHALARVLIIVLSQFGFCTCIKSKYHCQLLVDYVSCMLNLKNCYRTRKVVFLCILYLTWYWLPYRNDRRRESYTKLKVLWSGDPSHCLEYSKA
ncbi:hypothetical protein GmHk_06G015801 [Glycine max]|nr:hypothetical protein GmHk_06G015801 [Glycine max]